MTSAAVSPTMVGRQSQLARVREAYEAAADGEFRAVVLGGEAGVGKTRLLRELGASIGDEAHVLFGQCVDLGDVAAPYAPVTSALRELAGRLGAERLLDAAGPGRILLSALLPELAAGETGEAGDAVRIVDSGGRLHEAVAVLLESVSAERPVVLVVEDLHWVDGSTLALLRFLLRSLAGRVLLVLSYRSEDVGRGHPVRAFLSESDRLRAVDRWELSRLTRGQVRKQMRAITGRTPTDAVLDRVFRRSDGVPFFVEELLDCDDSVPETLRELLLGRYERLSDEAQALLRLVSTGGVRVSHAALAEVFDGPADALDAGAREAVAAGVLVVDGDDYVFRHALVREAVLDDLLPGERARFHARYAAYFERAAEAGRRVAAEISFHWMGAHDAEKAFPATIDAMRQARDAYAYATAGALGERALELWDRVGEPASIAEMSRIVLFSRTAAHLDKAGESARARALLERAIEECAPDDPQLPRLLRDLSRYTYDGNQQRVELLERSLEYLPPGTDDMLRTTVIAELAGRLMVASRYDEALALADEAVELGLRSDAPRYSSVAANIRGVTRAHARGEIDEAFADLARAREYAGSDGAALLRYWVNASDLTHLVGRYEDALHLAEEGMRRAAEIGVARSSGTILMSNAAEPLLELGRLDEARQLVDRAIGMDPPVTYRVYLESCSLWLAIWTGDLAGARELLDNRPATARRIAVDESQVRHPLLRARIELALAEGDPGGALTHAQAAADDLAAPDGSLRSQEAGHTLPLVWAMTRAVRAVRGADERGAGGRAGAVASSGADASGADAALTAVEAVARRVLAGTASWPTHGVWAPMAAAELAGDAPAFRAAIDAAESELAPAHLMPYALLQLARALLAAGERREGRTVLGRARETAAEIGLGLLVAEADAMGHAAGGIGAAAAGADASGADAGSAADAGRRAAASTPDPLAELTARERQVLDLVAEGLSNRQIGERLFISGKTASVHVSAILRKLGASTRTEAARLAAGPPARAG
ncbi:helix-turn-helix transcriptional regulator [Agromyces archimandritae]|uniref:AAA family ATPase n=1 Tax=Agromyces archimandritae TaxID=2781962 RepID=A0A975IPT6_9MICO|nr:LuxR family transcriptional regulator [Agromyces archimandritae]QTX05947.1 AAA family ATPase [Agromyces archimandritae]